MKQKVLLIAAALMATTTGVFAQNNLIGSKASNQEWIKVESSSLNLAGTETVVALNPSEARGSRAANKEGKAEMVVRQPLTKAASLKSFRHHEEGFYSGTSLFRFGIDIGLNRFLNTDDAGSAPDLKTFGSRYVSLNWSPNFQIGGITSPFYLISGLEFSFNNYMFDDNVVVQDVNNVTEFTQVESVNLDKSKLSQSAINIPLIAMLNFKRADGSNGFKVGAGGFAGYRLGSHSKLKYDENSSTVKLKIRDNYNLTDFQYGLKGVIGYGAINFFVKYNMNELFRDEDRGPEANVISFGLNFLSY
ncbi:outer membrane beta-barrel protein [Pontibacter silvestris]|uniref:Outer membrane beta-barrel protein n=1 Tax=Pontibacter silvestris TaxID=2305183 RepID=A0ABW4WZZ1_9BACT|nr:outer membrane beta-barrel protein [Pontibacter silvestris]MCC9135400.1 outer membrane beta-barrel protein [Pontibacter silvestris]